MKPLRIIALLGNTALLIMIFVLAVNGNGFSDAKDFMYFLALVYLLVINIYLIWNQGGESWIGLFLKRKALEEKQKIKDLES